MKNERRTARESWTFWASIVPPRGTIGALKPGWDDRGSDPWRGGDRPDLSPSRLRYLQARTEEWEGGFGFWRSRDGVRWTAITTDGFDDNPYTYAIRELVPTPHGLFAATIANRSSQFGGGLRVWLGSPRPARRRGR